MTVSLAQLVQVISKHELRVTVLVAPVGSVIDRGSLACIRIIPAVNQGVLLLDAGLRSVGQLDAEGRCVVLYFIGLVGVLIRLKHREWSEDATILCFYERRRLNRRRVIRIRSIVIRRHIVEVCRVVRIGRSTDKRRIQMMILISARPLCVQHLRPQFLVQSLWVQLKVREGCKVRVT